jgi:hypothetical protein
MMPALLSFHNIIFHCSACSHIALSALWRFVCFSFQQHVVGDAFVQKYLQKKAASAAALSGAPRRAQPIAAAAAAPSAAAAAATH